MDFEWNENKREYNLEKHGIDFIDAVEIFDDPDRIEAESIRERERRCQTIGLVNDVVLFVVYTHRSKIKRIISARRASKNERKTYYEANENEG